MIYLDFTATTKPDPKILDLHKKINEEYWYNSEALYNGGVKSFALIEKSEKVVLDTLKLKNKNVLFTSGATEANNTAIYGICNQYLDNPKHIITTKVEHASVLNCFKDLETKGFKVTYLNVNEQGEIDVKELESSITQDTILVSIMWVNNIIGTIEPIKDVINIIKKYPRIKLHVDAVQGIGKIKPDFDLNNVDMITISGHKLHGIKGTGCLIYNQNINLSFLKGGHQQKGIRPGTSDVAGIVSMAKTIQLYSLYNNENYNDVLKKYSYLVKQLKDLDYIVLNRSLNNYSPYILSISFKKVKGETVLHSLEQDNIYVGTGSACNSHSKDLEQTLVLVTKDNTLAINTIRVSLDPTVSYDDLNILIKKIIEIGNR